MAKLFRLCAGWSAVVIATGALLACSGRVGKATGMFAPCPASPNCVSTDAQDSRHMVAPFLLMRPESGIWPEVRAAVLKLPRTTIVAEDHHYLHAEWRSNVFGFVDDLEIQLRPGDRLLAMRSASRTGYYDFGVNRRRVETLRGLLRNRGIIQ